jgi:hypothetical protein
LNLRATTVPASASSGAHAAPRLMEVGEATAWSGQGRVSEGRHRSTRLIVTLMAVVGAIIVIFAINFTRKPPVVATAPVPRKVGIDSEAMAKLAETAAHEATLKPDPTAPVVAERAPAAVEPARPRGPHGRPLRGGRAVAQRGPSAAVSPAVGAAPAAAPAAPATSSSSGGVGRERSVTPVSAVANRPAPSQAEISRVIANNKIGIKTCYQRALLRDSSLTHGKIVVGVTIGISGRVKHVTVDGPSSFRTLEPCIKEMLARWVFPQSYEEYGTEFSYLFQGNE